MEREKISRIHQFLISLSNQWFSNNGNVVVNPYDMNAIKNEIILVAQDIQMIHPSISKELFGLKDTIFSVGGFINPIELGKLIALIWSLKKDSNNKGFENMLHPMIIAVSLKLFNNGHYAEAAENAYIEINKRVKDIYEKLEPNATKVPDGVELMHITFSSNKPIVKLADISTETGKNIQRGYMDMFAGAIAALRNPKAHENIELDMEECKKRLVFASMLMNKLDEVSDMEKDFM